jgi:hypothetical protein
MIHSGQLARTGTTKGVEQHSNIQDTQARTLALFKRRLSGCPARTQNGHRGRRLSICCYSWHRSSDMRARSRCLHHFVGHPAKEEGIGLVEVLERVTMQVFVREHCTMIAAPVQCDVDGEYRRGRMT